MDVRILHNRDLWNGFLAQQLGQYSYQTFEWGEYLNRHGHIVFRLGAFVEERLVGVMLLAVTTVPISIPFSLLNLKWMYCYQGPCITGRHPEALGALLVEAHAIAKHERAIMMRIEAPRDVRDDDAYLWHRTLQRLQHGLNGYASDWAKAQGLLHYEMRVISADSHQPVGASTTQPHIATSHTGGVATIEQVQTKAQEREQFGPIYDFVYRPFFYRLWTSLSHGRLPSSAQAFQQMQQQIADAKTMPMRV
jgi:hypothetical protein